MKRANIQLEKDAERKARKLAKRGKVRNPNGSIQKKKHRLVLDTLGENTIK